MRTLLVLFLTFTSVFSFSQEKDQEKEQLLAIKKSNDFVYEANELMDDNNVISAEKEYRKAISEQPSSVAGTYNLGNSYYKKAIMKKHYTDNSKLQKMPRKKLISIRHFIILEIF